MEPLIPISLFLGAFAMIFGIRYFSNKEKMAMIERGFDPRTNKERSVSPPMPFLSLKFGLLLIGIGIGLLVALFTVRAMHFPDYGNNGQQVAIYFGSIGIFGGLGLVVSFIFEKKEIDKH